MRRCEGGAAECLRANEVECVSVQCVNESAFPRVCNGCNVCQCSVSMRGQLFMREGRTA